LDLKKKKKNYYYYKKTRSKITYFTYSKSSSFHSGIPRLMFPFFSGRPEKLAVPFFGAN
jgi:hypothetical protein